MKKIIIGKSGYDVLKYKSDLRKDEWANCIPCSIRIKMNIEDCLNLKWIVDKFEGDFNFESIEGDGVYSCNGTLSNIQIMSKFQNDDVLCKISLVIWEKKQLDKSEARSTILDDVLSV